MNNRWLVGTRMAYLIVAWLFVVAILYQVLLIGLNLFAGEATRGAHIGFGHTLGILPLLLLILAFVGRMPGWAKSLAGWQFVTFIVQAEVFAAIRGQLPVLAAFHPVLALVLFTLAVVVAQRAPTLLRTPDGSPADLGRVRA